MSPISECVLIDEPPPFDVSTTCHISTSCQVVTCCTIVEKLQRSFQTILSINTATNTFSVSECVLIDKPPPFDVSTTCHISTSCQVVTCCTRVEKLQRSFQTILSIDTATNTFSVSECVLIDEPPPLDVSTTCHISTSCQIVTCCTRVDKLQRSFQTSLSIDTATNTFSVAVENFRVHKPLMELPLNQEKTFSMIGIVALR